MTVKELLELCVIQVTKGNGDKNIVISDDEEGNGYHDLFYPFLTNEKEIAELIEDTGSRCHCSGDVKDMIVLG